MSVQRIIQESIEKNPLGLKEAFAEELSNRIRLALEAKMSEEIDQLDEASVKTFMGKHQVIHKGDVVATYVAKYEAQDHARQINDEERRNRKKKTYKEDEDLDEEVEQLDELSPGVLGRYMHKSSGMDDSKDKNVGSIRRLSAQGKAHRVLGNDKEADRLRDKSKKRSAGFAKALARHDAATGFKKQGDRPAVKGSPVDKATKKMPSSYYKEETEE
jgi:hypothetical protein